MQLGLRHRDGAAMGTAVQPSRSASGGMSSGGRATGARCAAVRRCGRRYSGVVQLAGQAGQLLTRGVDRYAAGVQVHHGYGAGDGEVGTLQPAATAEGVNQSGGTGVGPAVHRLFKQFGTVARDGRNRDAEVIGCGIAMTGPFGDFQDPGQVDM